MPSGTCDPASRGDAYNQVAEEVPAPDGSGSVLIDCRFGWDGVSVMPNCDGPTQSIRTRNTSSQTAWASLPNKKSGSAWIQIDPGTDATTSSSGTLDNLTGKNTRNATLASAGLTNYSDVAAVSIVFTQPI